MVQKAFLSQAAMGFRAQAETLHVAQLLADVIELQKCCRKKLLLATFDMEKCFDSLPW